MTLLQNVEAVLGAVEDLRELRNRLGELDDERKAIEEQIKVRLAKIAGAADPTPPASQPRVESSSQPVRVTADRVFETAARFVGQDVGAQDIAAAWGTTDQATLDSIRAALSRLTASNRLIKVKYGRYLAVQPDSTTGGESAA